MQSQKSEIFGKSVNGSRASSLPAASLGRTRHEQQVASDRHQATVCKPKPLACGQVRIGTWNVNTLYQSGKLINVEREMRRLKLNILGVAEVRWSGVGSVKLDDGGCLIYSGGLNHIYGVGIMLGQKAE